MTLDELARLVGDMRDVMARVEVKLDYVVSGHSDHEDRIRWLTARVPDDLPKQLDDAKRFRWTLLGGAAAAGTAAGGIGAAVFRAIAGG